MPFLLDTCSLSEFVVKTPDRAVIRRIRSLPALETFIPSIAIGELKEGIDGMVSSTRKDDLEAWLFNQLIPAYSDRIIPFDKEEALRWGHLLAQLRMRGKAMETEDSLIAAVALTHDLTLVTRNESDFTHCDVRIYNPWK